MTEKDQNPGNAKPQLGSQPDYAELELSAPGSSVPGSSAPSHNKPSHHGWYSRGYLPHLDVPDILQFITFRLADSLPQTILKQLELELLQVPVSIRERERRKKIEHWLDAGLGCCALGHPLVADLMQETLQLFDGERYRLIAWCVMPNHVHVLIEPIFRLPKILQSWKSFTGRWAMANNTKLGLGIPGTPFWMREYWDRYIRDEAHFYSTINYIHNNPVKAKLCAAPSDWPWSSAYIGDND